MGAQGINVGAQSKAIKPDPNLYISTPPTADSPASLLSSPYMGAIHAVQGATEGDVGKTVSGIGEAATIPSMVMGGPAAKAGAEAIPSAKFAGSVIGDIEKAHGSLPVNPQAAERVAQEAKRLKQLGGYQLPSPIRAFLNRLNEPNVLTLEDARKTYSSAVSRLSPDEASKIKPVMRRQMAIFADKLGTAISDALAPTGKADEFMNALNEYHRAKRMQDVAKTAAKVTAAGVAGNALVQGGISAYNKLSK